jgi:hypothetical protein
MAVSEVDHAQLVGELRALRAKVEENAALLRSLLRLQEAREASWPPKAAVDRAYAHDDVLPPSRIEELLLAAFPKPMVPAEDYDGLRRVIEKAYEAAMEFESDPHQTLVVVCEWLERAAAGRVDA